MIKELNGVARLIMDLWENELKDDYVLQESDDPLLVESVKTTAENCGGRRRLVFYTGAGMSHESGLPTFRGEGGLWEWGVLGL